MTWESHEIKSVIKSINLVAHQLQYLGNGGAETQIGAIEGHGMKMVEAAEKIERGLNEVALAIWQAAHSSYWVK